MKHFLERISDIVAKYPDRYALKDGKETLTYRELDLESGCVYRYLKEHGIGKEQFIVIYIKKCVHFASAILGVSKAGAAYILIEEGAPEERVAHIKKDSGCVLTIDEALLNEILRNYEPLSGYEETDLHDAAYAVYTSGSTGNPKGVLHEFGNLDQCVSTEKEESEYDECIFGYSSSLNFIAVQVHILTALITAKTVYLIPAEILHDFNAFQKILIDERIDSIFLPPSFLRHYNTPSPYLKHIIVGSAPAYGIYYPNGPVVENNYAMSETGFTVFRGILEKSFDEPPVGRPIIDIDIYLIDENENIVEGAGKGELCFVNEYVRGYINLPEQTQKAFRPMKGNPEKILFHTNDIFRRDSDGRYYVVGRIDDMMKINGNRIEPGEIEAKIKEITGLDDVMAKGFSEKDHAYIAVYFLREEAAKKGIWNGKTFSIDQEKLLKLLPSYMIPTYYVPLDAFPLNANGKMTRKELPAPDLAAMKGAYIAPETELERYICDAMSKVLKLDRMSVTEDFFVAGGDSLTAMSLLSEADIDDLTTDDLFKKRTPRAIAKALKERIRKGSIDELEDSARKVPHNITPLQRQIIDVQLFKPYATMWNNMRFLARFDLSIDAERLCIALNKALQNHPSLSVAFRFNDDNELEQQYIPGLLSERKIHEISEKDAERLSKELVKPFFKIFNSCLCRADIFRSPKYVYMFIDIHHLLMDGTSYGILLDDIVKAYNGQELKKDYYFAMLQEEEERIASGKMKEAEYWFKNTYGDEVWCEIVPPYYDSKNINQAERIRRLDFNLEKVNEAETYWVTKLLRKI